MRAAQSGPLLVLFPWAGTGTNSRKLKGRLLLRRLAGRLKSALPPLVSCCCLLFARRKAARGCTLERRASSHTLPAPSPPPWLHLKLMSSSSSGFFHRPAHRRQLPPSSDASLLHRHTTYTFARHTHTPISAPAGPTLSESAADCAPRKKQQQQQSAGPPASRRGAHL